MDNENPGGVPEPEIRIDYENVDVADIMAQIRARIALRPPVPPEEPADLEEAAPVFSGSYPEGPSEEPPSGGKGRAKRILLKIMRPFAPVIKLLVLPVNEELVRTVRVLDHTNKKLDYLSAKFDHDLHQSAAGLDRRIIQVDQALNQRIDELAGRLSTTMETVKLLHNLSHNLVVEITKLKIEHETLKSKVRVMEKDFEMLGRREKALEKEVSS